MKSSKKIITVHILLCFVILLVSAVAAVFLSRIFLSLGILAVIILTNVMLTDLEDSKRHELKMEFLEKHHKIKMKKRAAERHRRAC